MGILNKKFVRDRQRKASVCVCVCVCVCLSLIECERAKKLNACSDTLEMC